MQQTQMQFLGLVGAGGANPVLLGSLEEKFWTFHTANPHVYKALRRMALEMHRRGVRRYGIAGLFEVLRYEQALQTGGDEFKLNNSWRSFYARLLVANEPELKNFFELRTLRWVDEAVKE